MLETLEGRLKWERTAQGILVSVPVRRGPSLAGYALLVVVWLTIASIHYWHLFSSPTADTPERTLQFAAIAIYVFGFFLFLAWLLWTATGETMVMLDSEELRIQRRVIGIDVSTSTYRTSDIRNVRFVRPTPFWALRSDTDPSTSKIQFVTTRGFHSFAKGIGESEAAALIERMVEIYRFPRSGESYYGAVAK